MQSINKGKICTVGGPVSGMGRLDCKTPSLLAFDILSIAADECVVISEDEAEESVRADKKFNLNTSQSGAAGLAALLANSEPNPAPLIIITENAIP
jgi:diaminopropionate ammonia-lyase